jgi:hypothetical protein
VHARWNVQLVMNGGNQSWTSVTKKLDPNRFDLMLVLVRDRRRWLIAAAALDAETSVKSRRTPSTRSSEVQPGTSIEDLVNETAGSRI